jgi:hypothetical protein
MKAHTLLTKAAAGLTAAVLTVALGACSHHKLATGQDSGEIRTEQAAQQQATSGNTIATAPAPSNAQGVSGGTQTPAIISGPAKVDNSGRVYTSSSVGSTGNASATGLNTNVNIIPAKPAPGTVTVTEVPAPTVTTVETPAPETPAPAPVVEAPAPTPAPVVEAPPPMTSSTTTTTHRRLRKD